MKCSCADVKLILTLWLRDGRFVEIFSCVAYSQMVCEAYTRETCFTTMALKGLAADESPGFVERSSLNFVLPLILAAEILC